MNLKLNLLLKILKRDPQKPLETPDELQTDSKASEEDICGCKKIQQISRCDPLTADRQQQTFDFFQTQRPSRIEESSENPQSSQWNIKYFIYIWILPSCQAPNFSRKLFDHFFSAESPVSGENSDKYYELSFKVSEERITCQFSHFVSLYPCYMLG